jgi:hypothetical protein
MSNCRTLQTSRMEASTKLQRTGKKSQGQLKPSLPQQHVLHFCESKHATCVRVFFYCRNSQNFEANAEDETYPSWMPVARHVSACLIMCTCSRMFTLRVEWRLTV